MSSPDRLLQATFNRLAARLGQKAIETAAEIAYIAKDAPEKIKQELDLFQEEVLAEADRLDKESAHEQSTEGLENTASNNESPQLKIDHLREKVAELSRKLEGDNS